MDVISRTGPNEPSLTVELCNLPTNILITTAKTAENILYETCKLPREVLKLISGYAQPVLLIVAVEPETRGGPFRWVSMWELGVLDGTNKPQQKNIVATAQADGLREPTVHRHGHRYLLTDTIPFNAPTATYYSSLDRKKSTVSTARTREAKGAYHEPRLMNVGDTPSWCWNPQTDQKYLYSCWDRMQLDWCNFKFGAEFRHMGLKYRRRALANRGHKIPCCVWMIWMDCPRSFYNDELSNAGKAQERQNRRTCNQVNKNSVTTSDDRVRLLMHVLPVKNPCRHTDEALAKQNQNVVYPFEKEDSGAAVYLYGINDQEVGVCIGERLYRLSTRVPSYDTLSTSSFDRIANTWSVYENRLLIGTHDRGTIIEWTPQSATTDQTKDSAMQSIQSVDTLEIWQIDSNNKHSVVLRGTVEHLPLSTSFSISILN